MTDNTQVKQRFFLQIPEVMRIRVDVRHLVGLIRGEQYVRLQAMRGEDFAFVLVRTCLSLYRIRAMTVFETLTYYLKAKFAIDISPGDLTFDLPRNAPVSVAYTLLDVLFVCILSYDFHAYKKKREDQFLSSFDRNDVQVGSMAQRRFPPVALVECVADIALKRHKARRLHLVIVDLWSHGRSTKRK